MAYMNQQRKALIAADLKKVIPAGWKYSLAVEHHSTIVLTISEAPVDILEDVFQMVRLEHQDNPFSREFQRPTYWGVNSYYIDRQFLLYRDQFKAIVAAMNEGNHDRSDVMSDYFDVNWYIEIQIGRWNKPFSFAPKTESSSCQEQSHYLAESSAA